MRAKEAKTEKRAKVADVLAVGREGSGKRKSRKKRKSGAADEKRGRVLGENRGDEVGIGGVGMGEPWSVQARVQSQVKDRSVAAPALPVPIVSFTI